MSKQFAFDLRLARKKSGLTQRDVAQLMDVSQSTLSDLERGIYRPSIEQVCALSLIFGRNFEHLFAEVIDEAKQGIKNRIASLPADAGESPELTRREASLQRLEERLAATDEEHDGE